MRYPGLLLLPLSLLLVSCASPTYKVSKDEYRERVKVLGVLPLMLDETSEIRHPQAAEVFSLLRRQNYGKSAQLTEMLRKTKGYFDVRQVAGEPDELYGALVAGSTLQGQGEKRYRKYHFQPAALSSLAAREGVDGFLVVVMNGLVRQEKRWDRVSLSATYLLADYNSIVVTAAVVAPTGEVLWELAGEPAGNFLPLQYPDFEEAFYNKTEAVAIKFITLPGLDRTLAEKEKGLFSRDPFPRIYRELFEKISGGLTSGMLNPFKSK